MKVLVTYGAAARPAIPGLRDLIDSFNQSVARREFSRGKLNNRRIADVEAAIKAIETAKDQPKLRSIPKK